MAIQLMACRDLFLKYCWAGFAQSGRLLVPFDGNTYIPFPARFDDIGMYSGVPLLGFLARVSYGHALSLFFGGLALIALTFSLIGIWRLYSSWWPRFIACANVGAALWLAYYISDVYTAYSFAALPIFFVIGSIHAGRTAWWSWLMLGVYWGFLNYVRAYSALGPVIIGIGMILIAPYTRAKKALLLGSLLLGMLLSALYMRHIISGYQDFARKHIAGHEEASVGHTFWHPVYLGFGLLAYGNKDGIIWDDSYGYKKYFTVEQYDNTLQNQHYEHLIARDARRLFIEQPRFVIWTIASKMGILLLYFLLIMNVALLALCRTWHVQRMHYSIFFIGLACTALFPLIALPLLSYSLGFIAMALVFAAYALNTYWIQYGFRWWIALYPLALIGMRLLVRFL